MKWQKESHKGLMTDPWDGLAKVPVEGAAGSIVTLCEMRSIVTLCEMRWVEVIIVVADSSKTGDSRGETEVKRACPLGLPRVMWVVLFYM